MNHQEEMPNGVFPDISLLEEQETFEFGCSQSLECSPNSPADHLFLNGKLQPHVFPSPLPQKNPNPTSRNSSTRSDNDSLLSSSRSNSTSSSSGGGGGGGSARTSISESSSRKVASIGGRRRKSTSSLSKEESSFWRQYYHQDDKRPVALSPDFGSSLRWQFITPVPDFKSPSARRSMRVQQVELETLRMRSEKGNGNDANTWFGLKMVRVLATACLSCHSIRPASAEQ